MSTITDVLGTRIKEINELYRQLSAAGDIVTHYLIFLEEIKPRHIHTKVDMRGIGSSLVLGDDVYGLLGTQTPQPYLGDSRPAWTNKLSTTHSDREFLDSGKEQVRDYLLGSSAAVAPTALLVGSGTKTWASTITSLGSQSQSIGFNSYTEDVKLGSYTAVIESCNLPTGGSTFTEVGLNGGKLFIYDSFAAQTLGATGSEIRFNLGIKVGS